MSLDELDGASPKLCGHLLNHKRFELLRHDITTGKLIERQPGSPGQS
jgi:hypothetical protein